VRRQRLTETSTWSTGFDGIQPNAMVQSSCKPSRFLSFMWPAELRSAHIFFFFLSYMDFSTVYLTQPIYVQDLHVFIQFDFFAIMKYIWSHFFRFLLTTLPRKKMVSWMFCLEYVHVFFLLLLSQRKKVDAIDDVHCSISMHQHARAVVDHRLPAPARRHVCVCHLKRRKREIRQAGYAFDSGPWHVFTLWSRPKRAMVIDDSASSRPTWSSRLTFKRAGQTAKGLGRSR
jgi:hypothetical protein